MPGEALFKEVMDGGLRDWLAGQADARAGALAERSRRLMLAVAAGLIVGGLTLAFFRESLVFLGAGGAVMGLGWAWAQKPVEAVTGDIKLAANDALAQALGVTYLPGGGPGADFALARTMGLLPARADEEAHTDFWHGTFKGVPIDLHESHLQEWVRQGKTRRLETIFRGVIVAWQFARPFAATTILKRDGGLLNMFSAWGAKLAGRGLEPVRFPDPRFEAVFELYSSDQVEARWLVHPAFCERLLEMERAFHARNLRMVFAQGRVVAVMETEDLLQTGGIDAAGDEARVAETIAQLDSLVTLATTLNERPRARA
jgi:hypothetical protein